MKRLYFYNLGAPGIKFNKKSFLTALEHVANSKEKISNFSYYPEHSTGIVDADSLETAELLEDTFNGQNLFDRALKVKILGHRAKIWVGKLSSAVTNESLSKAFNIFGTVSRAIVCTDSTNKSKGWGFVEFDSHTSAKQAVEDCIEKSFLLTKLGPPVTVEFWNHTDETYGIEFIELSKGQQQISVQPRFSEHHSVEEKFAKHWKELFKEEKKLKDEFKKKLMIKRKDLLQKQREALTYVDKKPQPAKPMPKDIQDRLRKLQDEQQKLLAQYRLPAKEETSTEQSEEKENNLIVRNTAPEQNSIPHTALHPQPPPSQAALVEQDPLPNSRKPKPNQLRLQARNSQQFQRQPPQNPTYREPFLPPQNPAYREPFLPPPYHPNPNNAYFAGNRHQKPFNQKRPLPYHPTHDRKQNNAFKQMPAMPPPWGKPRQANQQQKFKNPRHRNKRRRIN